MGIIDSQAVQPLRSIHKMASVVVIVKNVSVNE
jgi:hypothetical protein